MIFKSTSSESLAIALQLVKSAGFGSSPCALGPSPFPPTPWHTEHNSWKSTAVFSAAKSHEGTERLQYKNAIAGKRIDGLAAILLLEPL
jgi:hypothetical protein